MNARKCTPCPSKSAVSLEDKQISSTTSSIPSTSSSLFESMELATPSVNPSHTEPSISNSATNPSISGDNESRDTLLRDMIATPLSRSSLSISSVPRQNLSTVCVTLHSKEPYPKSNSSIASKLDKEICCLCKHNSGKPCWMLFQVPSFFVLQLVFMFTHQN